MSHTASSRALAIDGGAVAAVAIATVAAADHPAVMTAVVALAIAARFALWAALPTTEREPARVELPIFALGLALGAANDWNTVARHGVYAYGVPGAAVPVWMLAYWGLIVRLMLTVARWHRLAPPPLPRPTAARAAFLLALVIVTRQAIYRWYGDPVLSWLPFAAALAAYAAVARPGRYQLRLAAVVALAGPAAEIALIQLAGLHRYELGWLAGVPLWIALWWILAAMIWAELGTALIARLRFR